ncbi:diguanylate cyclase [Deinococcus irradiatisoli]|uniref:Diguanylate cyclase n=1 Tax=Deinococcus irradiatisoli TaxID=2202254 RepID=A0A2Z3JF50_9DEIO|nr:CHASE2 domain-containing protein [Deinococcus irradiatisoli]AWN23662.1 diguanylate cyclase [Deinococcus irradiatisoli]
MPRPERLLLAALAAVLAACVFALVPINPPLRDVLNRNLPAPPDPRVVVVGIDDLSLQTYGPQDRWDRALYARALDTLREAGARAVGLDIRFAAPAPGDAALARAVGRPGVVLASSLQQPQGARDWNATYGVSAFTLSRGAVRTFQTAYRGESGTLWPSLSAQLARLAGVPRPLSTEPQVLRATISDPQALPVLSFRDVVGGNLRATDVQNKVVLIGLTASGLPGTTLLDSRLDLVPGVVLQARAVSSLLSEPFRRVSPWITWPLCAALAASAVLLGGLWGFGLALLGLTLSAPLFLNGWLFPGITVSLSAIIGTAFAAGERVWTLRRIGTLDPLTGLGNRLAFTRAAENRWPGRATRPVGLLLVDLGGLKRITEVHGQLAGDELLREVAQALRLGRTRRDLVFRWGSDEFAVLVDPASDVARLAQQLQTTLAALHYKDMPLQVSLGQAVSTPQMTQPSELVEQASRDRYRTRYRLQQR